MSAKLLGLPDPRPRTAANGNYYHIVLRGNRRQPLFSAAADRRALNRFAIDALLRYDATLHAYCLMPHNFRFLVQMEERRLIKAIRRIVRRYSRHLHRHARLAEPPFERPHEARRIATGDEFLECLRSIHLGPVVGNLVSTPDEYRWSSHRAYLGFKSATWVQTAFGLSLLSPDLSRARCAYPEFMSGGGAIQVEQSQSTNASAVVHRLMGSRNPDIASGHEAAGRSDLALEAVARSIGDSQIDRQRRFLAIY